MLGVREVLARSRGSNGHRAQRGNAKSTSSYNSLLRLAQARLIIKEFLIWAMLVFEFRGFRRQKKLNTRLLWQDTDHEKTNQKAWIYIWIALFRLLCGHIMSIVCQK